MKTGGVTDLASVTLIMESHRDWFEGVDSVELRLRLSSARPLSRQVKDICHKDYIVFKQSILFS